MGENKLVTYKQLQIGQKIEGTQDSGRHHMFSAFVKEINPISVTVEMWRKGGTEEKINSSFMFEVEMSEKEFEDKYREKAKEILKNIQNKLSVDEIGYHEMDNSWLYGTPYEMAKYCIRDKTTILGHSNDIIPKTSLFSDDALDIGVCCAYEDGERFWCHYRYSDIENMLDDYKDLLE